MVLDLCVSSEQHPQLVNSPELKAGAVLEAVTLGAVGVFDGSVLFVLESVHLLVDQWLPIGIPIEMLTLVRPPLPSARRTPFASSSS